jgi:tRNA A64-2'-O-ribosylphosphate transferase
VYVQGAADDEEAWSHKLTSIQFWENYKKLLQCTQEDELVDVIRRIVENYAPTQTIAGVSPIASTGLYLGIGDSLPGTTKIICRVQESALCDGSQTLSVSLPVKSKPYVELTQKIFPAAVTFAYYHGILNNTKMTVVATDMSRSSLDLSIAVTLVLLCLYFDDEGEYLPQHNLIVGNAIDRREVTMTKEIIRTRLVWIITARGQQAERVSRQILKIVNTYLMSRPPQKVVSNV